MAVKDATTVKPGAVAVDDEVPEGIPRHGRDGRPKIRDAADTAKFSYYSRASSFGKVLDDQYNLSLWGERMVGFGLSRRDDLVMALQAIAACEDKGDEARHKALRDAIQEITDKAKEAAGAGRQATKGTALHALSERLDAGDDLAFVGATTFKALGQWRRMMAGFDVVGTEQFVVNDALRSAGSYDRLLSPREPLPVVIPVDGVMTQVALIEPGECLVADLKSGASDKWFGDTYAVQQWVYASGTPYVHVSDAAAAKGDSGRCGWPGGATPRQDWALIPHVPVDHPEDAGLLWVNLERAAELATLSRTVRDERGQRARLYFEAAVPGAPLSPAEQVAAFRASELLVALGLVNDEADVDALYAGNADVWTDAHSAAARARLAELVAS